MTTASLIDWHALAGRSGRAPCPLCAKPRARDRTLSYTRDTRGAVAHCFRCGYVETLTAPRVDRRPPTRTPSKSAPLEWSTTAEAIWRRTEPVRGTLGQVYLEHRGCALPPRDSHLRYLPPDDRHAPTLCAAITDARTGRPISLHFTKLRADGRGKAGTDRDRTLLSRHRKAGGVIRLWPDESVTRGLAIAEGIETALAAAHAFSPAWACVDAGNMAGFPVLAGIEALTVLADHDEAGLRAARLVAQRWADAGREVRLVVPPNAGTDVADVAVAA